MPHRIPRHRERHYSGRGSWLRAAVLGSNDAIVSTASLMMGVAASQATGGELLTAGFAGVCAGAMSMAVGEYVSVCAQRDAEEADIAQEKHELAASPGAELDELTLIYIRRGLDPSLAREVAEQLSTTDRLGAHLRDELGIDTDSRARPLQAAWISAVSFAAFGMLPILGLLVAPDGHRMASIAVTTLLSLAVLGALGGRLGGAPMLPAALRVTIGGALAMLVTGLIGRLVGVAIA